VPVGDSPTGTGDDIPLSDAISLRLDCPPYSAGPVARRDGRVARPTRALRNIRAILRKAIVFIVHIYLTATSHTLARRDLPAKPSTQSTTT
jgi:hypothetical protein